MSEDFSHSDRPQKRSFKIDQGIAAVVAAVILAAGGFAGAFIGRATSHNASTAQPTVTVTVTASARNAAGGGNTSNPTPPSDSSNPTKVFHAGMLNLALDAAADLDTPASDPTWRVTSLPQGATADISWQGGGLYLQGSAQGFVTDKAGNSTCQSSSGYGTSFLDLEQKPIGTFVCIYTNEKHYALLKMTKDSGNDGASFTVTTFG